MAQIGSFDTLKGHKQITTMYPERRFYKASRKAPTIPRIRSTPAEDLHLVYEGLNPDTGRLIVRAHINPLVMWIWADIWIVILDTSVALVPTHKQQSASPRQNQLRTQPPRSELEITMSAIDRVKTVRVEDEAWRWIA